MIKLRIYEYGTRIADERSGLELLQELADARPGPVALLGEVMRQLVVDICDTKSHRGQSSHGNFRIPQFTHRGRRPFPGPANAILFPVFPNHRWPMAPLLLLSLPVSCRPGSRATLFTAKTPSYITAAVSHFDAIVRPLADPLQSYLIRMKK